MSITLTALQKQRRDTAANWTSANPTLLAGEIGLESDTGYWKVGDGSTAWTSLAYVSGLGAEIPVSRLADGSARQLLQTAANGTDVEWTSNVDVPGTLDVTSTATFDSIASHPLGSAAAPTLTFTGDTNTGIYSPGADQVAISTGGSGRLFINSSGNVGVGSSSPGARLSIDSGATALAATINSTSAVGSQLRFDSSGTAFGYLGTPTGVIGSGSTTGFAVRSEDILVFGTGGANERIRITSAGFVGIGTTSPQNKFVVSNSGAEGIEFIPGYTSNRNVTIHYNRSGATYVQNDQIASAHVFRIASDSTQAAIIDSSGRLGVGTSSPGTKLHIGGETNPIIRINTSENSDTWSTTSDYGKLQFFSQDYEYGGGGEMAAIAVGVGSAFGNGPSLRFSVSNPSSGSANPGERMRLTATGLGIGTTSPQVLLHGQITSTASTNTEVFRLTDNALCDFRVFLDRGTALGNSTTRLKTANGILSFETSDTPRVTIDASGRLLVGTSSGSNNLRLNQNFTVVAVGNSSYGGMSLTGYSGATDASASPILDFQRSRGNTDGSYTEVVTGDQLGAIAFRGADGVGWSEAAAIKGEADGDWTTSGDTTDSPGRLVFSTTADGASSPTERMRITQDGYVRASNNASYQVGAFHEFNNNSTTAASLLVRTTTNSFTDNSIAVGCFRSANSAYRLLAAYSGDGSTNAYSDLEFNLRGDGNAFADGTWSGGGADYAEFFEWSDSNPDAEDRRGISVVLDGDKIREAVAGEDPIGVISGNPSVVGDAAWNKWSGKYLRDEFGSYLLDENGDRQLNPAFDPDVEYVSREQRPEWDCVGLMGKLRIRKGQVTGSRWIKMRDINDSVEEWLVR